MSGRRRDSLTGGAVPRGAVPNEVKGAQPKTNVEKPKNPPQGSSGVSPAPKNAK
jgi:hypothetical protein